jgi:hypothetical protein
MNDEQETNDKPARQRAEQDRDIAHEIAAAEQMIHTVQEQPDIAEKLANHGYDEAKLGEGSALQAGTNDRFYDRQEAMATQRQANARLIGAEAEARSAYNEFRIVARALFKDESDITALAIRGRIPGDRQNFLTMADTSYRAALTEPYSTILGQYGFAPEEIEGYAAALESLSAADEAQNAIDGDAMEATARRDQAYRALHEWMQQFKSIARVALKDDDDMSKALLL